MNNLKEYILEKLKIDKNIEIPKIKEGLPEIDSKVLVVSKGKKTSRESYVKYNICEVISYENENTLILRNSFGEEMSYKFKIRSENEINNSSLPTYIKYYFAEFSKGDYWARVYDKKAGLELIKYGITNLYRKLFYIYSAFKLDYNGNKIRYLEKLRDTLRYE